MAKSSGMKMRRMLCILGSMNVGGAETFMMKVLRSIDRKKFAIDFAVAINYEGVYDEEILSFGCKIYHIKPKSINIIDFIASIYHIVKDNNFVSVLRISQNSTSVIDLIIAKFAGAKRTAFRSSNSNVCGGWLDKIGHLVFKPLVMIVPNIKISPSDKAALFMFGQKCVKNGQVTILKNGLNLDQYSFNMKNREEYRASLNINKDTKLIGHIGRFSYQKNHVFLIDFFKDFQKTYPNSKLLLIGTGELENKIKEYVRVKNVDNIIFLGARQDIPELLSAMDVFMLPSIFEGMPNTVVEAQANGLPCVISDGITKQVNVTNNVQFLSLAESKNIWIKSVSESNRISAEEAKTFLYKAGYDINEVSKLFVKLFF